VHYLVPKWRHRRPDGTVDPRYRGGKTAHERGSKKRVANPEPARGRGGK